jgi:hypothetical protein
LTVRLRLVGTVVPRCCGGGLHRQAPHTA